jgi:hypothetical protein
MKGRFYESYVSLYDDNNDNDLFDNASDDYVESNTFGIDAGAMYKLGNTITLALSGEILIPQNLISHPEVNIKSTHRQEVG